MGSSIENMVSGGAYYGNQDMANDIKDAQGSTGGMFEPWISGGQNAYNAYQNAINNMQNPQQYYQQMMQGYQESPQAQQAIQQGIKAANAATAASGMQGSGAEQTALQKQGQDIVSADQQNWLNNMLGISNQYISGQGNLEGQGLSAAQDDANLQARLAEAYAKAQGAAEQAKSQGKGGAIGGSLGLLGDLGSGIFGDGSFFS